MKTEQSEMKTTAKQNSTNIVFQQGQNGLPALAITTQWSTAAVYLHGAHVTAFKKNAEPPLLFMSQSSRFASDHPIRGGVPVIFPWFGNREGVGMHGFVRTKQWEVNAISAAGDGGTSVRFLLPNYPEAQAYPPFNAEYVVTVGQTLKLELIITNLSRDQTFSFENCFHTYFGVGDVSNIAIKGLKGITYLNKPTNFSQHTETNEEIRIASEVDRVYLNTTDTVEILDPALHRKIRIEKHGSVSTVVWNPWIAKAKQMADFGDDEYKKMVCVESGNVASNNINLPPGDSSTLTVEISSQPSD
jgi:D-hexose-6-phosphate mutarotase